MPIGHDGELYLGGPGVARGYHDRPELTAERFVANPFPGGHGPRLYRTGDRVRFRADGRVEFRGRLDEQVKLRGHRIELGEIEAALRAVDGVRDAAVVLRHDRDGGSRLVGYVSASTPELTGDSCRVALRRHLPEVMVPATVVVVDTLPLTPNGKLDRQALPAPLAAPRAMPGAPPADDMQREVAAIWRDVLQLDAVAIDENFFDLGGHSLLTLQVAQRLGALIGRPVPITDLFRLPTIRALARHLAARDHDAAADAARSGQARAAARLAARSRGHDR